MATTPTKRPLESTQQSTLLYSPLDNKKTLGSGAFGNALLGRNRVTQSPLVFKAQQRITKYDKKITTREAAVTKLVTEKGIPHCVHYRDSYRGTLKDKPVQVLVTNLARGQTLDKIIKKDDQGNLAQCVTITKQLVECLRGLIGENVSHFDLKPANLIYDEKTRQLSVIDFGGAIKLDEMPLENQIITPNYASPESLLKNPLQEGRCLADIWSVGCILFELYTGNRLIPSFKPNQVPVPDSRLTPEEQKNYIRMQRNNYILQQIAAFIDMPSPDFLRSCPSASLYFTEDLQHFKTPLPGIESRNWRDEIRQAMEDTAEELEMEFDENEYTEVTQVLNAMLQYPGTRVAPDELLKYDFFQYDISFELDFGPYANQKLPIQITIFPDDISGDEKLKQTDSIRLDLNERVYSRCFHLGRDSASQYSVSLESNGVKTTQTLSLPEDGYTIDIAPLIDQILNPPAPAAADPEPKKSRKNLSVFFEKENILAAEHNPDPYLAALNQPLSRLDSVDVRLTSVADLLRYFE